MHEGVLIIAIDSKQIMFCNKPAQNLMKKYIGLLESPTELLTQNCLKPVQISERDMNNKYRLLVETTQKADLVNLE